MLRIIILLSVVLWPVHAPAALDIPLMPAAHVAFFGMTFIDTSTEGAYNGVRADETARVALLENAVSQRFTAEGFDVVSNEPIATELAGIVNPADCYGCERRMAAELGADYVLVGEIQKVSNLILSMNLVMRDVKTGHAVRALAVDIRSNTDESWLRGVNYILNNHFFKR